MPKKAILEKSPSNWKDYRCARKTLFLPLLNLKILKISVALSVVWALKRLVFTSDGFGVGSTVTRATTRSQKLSIFSHSTYDPVVFDMIKTRLLESEAEEKE